MKMTMVWMLGLLLGVSVARAEERVIEVKLTVPDSAWTLAIESVHDVNGEAWVVSRVSRHPDVMGLQVITTLKASVKVDVGALPMKVFVIGKTWNWTEETGYTYLKDLKEIEKQLAAGKALYPRAKQSE